MCICSIFVQIDVILRQILRVVLALSCVQIALHTRQQLLHPRHVLRARPIYHRIHAHLPTPAALRVTIILLPFVVLNRLVVKRVKPHAHLVCQLDAVGPARSVHLRQNEGVRDGVLVAPSHDARVNWGGIGQARVQQEVEAFQRRRRAALS
eukprot:CAMPEP_0172532830 /NCGR_PEP_ID=MMETSP1067-20121228/5734_1 /TAXON_ID=265564 ORGANISM="Thalassiosira punctigera, Strain Tpunct2005C2" /NCGR_SAMPLE_ID=MMETSP1067 /ASSEMBLY_ACC=CAM_ASM_000444 /LENGTH=150 /DNA_ID=CAMNT_0013317385 /DNA_START=64 /DNA_END=516 /DNA_ORIENTATION=+